MAVDYGTKNVGLAVSDDSKTFAMQLDPIKFKDSILKISSLAKDLEVTRIVIGVPLGDEGKETRISKKIREYSKELVYRTGIEVIYWDESYTSVFAKKSRRKKGSIDSESARIVLQEYLDFNREK